MFGINLPSVSDAARAVGGAASSALHTTEDLGGAALSHAASLGRAGLDLGRSAVNTLEHVDVQKLGATAVGAIGRGEAWAERGIRSGVMQAGQGVHAAADAARSHVTGGDPLSRLARGAITYTETQARFDLGVVGGVGKAAVGLVGSAGQLGVMAAEYQASPTARAAIDAKIGGAVAGAATSVAGYAESVAHDPSRVAGDLQAAGSGAAGWVRGEVADARQAVAEGHGPESLGLVVGDAATYAIPVGGEARALAGVGEAATRGLAGALAEDATRGLVEDGARAAAGDAGATVARSGAETAARDAGEPVAGAAAGGAAGRTTLEDAGRTLDRAAQGSASVADVRGALEALPVAERFDALKGFVGRMDVSTARDTATFWSGGVSTADGFISARGGAEAVAAAEGRATLETTPGGRLLDGLKLFDEDAPLVGDGQAMQLWETASARYAEAAQGDVVAVSANARPTSVWNRIERPILEQGLADGRITNIEVRPPISPPTP